MCKPPKICICQLVLESLINLATTSCPLLVTLLNCCFLILSECIYDLLLCPNTVWLHSHSLHKPFTHVDTETNCHHSAAANCLRRSSPQEEEEERPCTTTQQLPTISRRPSPREVQPLMISCQQAHTALLKLQKRPKKLEEPQVNPTYHLKKKTQSPHQQVPAPNRSDQTG